MHILAHFRKDMFSVSRRLFDNGAEDRYSKTGCGHTKIMADLATGHSDDERIAESEHDGPVNPEEVCYAETDKPFLGWYR